MNSAFERKVILPRWLAQLTFLLGPKSKRVNAQEGQREAQKRRKISDDDEISLDLRSLRLLNTYGAFGSINLERIEIVFEGTQDGLSWHPYKFKAAVDDPMKRPGWLAPYHLRLDWCRWIESCRGKQSSGLDSTWVLAFTRKLLKGNAGTRSLLAKHGDPFHGSTPPVQIRAELYRYTFAPAPRQRSDPYWLRERVGAYMQPLNLQDVEAKLVDHGFLS